VPTDDDEKTKPPTAAPVPSEREGNPSPDVAALMQALEMQRQTIESMLAAQRELLEKLSSTARVYPDTPIDTMSSAQIEESGTPGPKFSAKHPLPARIKALHMSTPKVAKELSKALGRKIVRTVVRSWYLPKGHDDARPIPLDAVAFFEREPWNIPRSAWKNVKDPE